MAELSSGLPTDKGGLLTREVPSSVMILGHAEGFMILWRNGVTQSNKLPARTRPLTTKRGGLLSALIAEASVKMF